MGSRAASLAAALVMAPLGAMAADFVVWWDEGYYPEEQQAVRDITAAFEQGSGKQVELVLYPQAELPGKIEAALEAGRPPDFAFGFDFTEHGARWAFENRLVDLSHAIGPFSNLFDPAALASTVLLNGRSGQKSLYGVPMGRTTNHVHVWKSLLEQAGFALTDSRASGRRSGRSGVIRCSRRCARRQAARNIWGIGLPISGVAYDTWFQFHQFMAAEQADYVTADCRLVIDDPEIRRKIIETMDSYTAFYRKGCTPPDSRTWANPDNNEQFLAQAVVMTPNEALSIPNALKGERPDDYYENVATIEWPLGSHGKPFPILGAVLFALAFKDGGNLGSAEEFVRFLVAEAWLMHYLNFSGEHVLPPISKLLDQPFWLDPSDPHRMASVVQVSSRPLAHDYVVASGNWRHVRVDSENVWGKAIDRVVTEGITPERAVDEAIARIKRF